jgi:hypothetical protein
MTGDSFSLWYDAVFEKYAASGHYIIEYNVQTGADIRRLLFGKRAALSDRRARYA